MSPLREQMIGVVASIVLVFLFASCSALFCLLYGSVGLAVVAIGAQMVAVPWVALFGYAHGRAMVGPVRSFDAISGLLLVSCLVGLAGS